MKLNDMFKAIRLRIKTSKPYLKDFYGDLCREFVFEDYLGNDVGVFVVHPEGDVCQIVVNAIIQNKQGSVDNITCRWINPLVKESRESILSKKSHQEQLREYFIYNNIPYETIDDSDCVLEVVSCVCDGHTFIPYDLRTPHHVEDFIFGNDSEIFLKLAKIAHKKNVSINDLVDGLLSNSLSNSLGSSRIEKINRNNLNSFKSGSDGAAFENRNMNTQNAQKEFKDIKLNTQRSQTSFVSSMSPQNIASKASDNVETLFQPSKISKDNRFGSGEAQVPDSKPSTSASAVVNGLTGSGVKAVKESRLAAHQFMRKENSNLGTQGVGAGVGLVEHNLAENDLQDFELKGLSDVLSLSKNIPMGDVSLDDELGVEDSQLDSYETLNDTSDTLLDVKDSYKVKIPSFIDGGFEIGKGFVTKSSVAEVSDVRTYSTKLSNNTNTNTTNDKSMQSATIQSIVPTSTSVKLKPMVDSEKRSLKDRVIPEVVNVNLNDGVINHIHRYPGDKTVLSNLKTIG